MALAGRERGAAHGPGALGTQPEGDAAGRKLAIPRRRLRGCANQPGHETRAAAVGDLSLGTRGGQLAREAVCFVVLRRWIEVDESRSDFRVLVRGAPPEAPERSLQSASNRRRRTGRLGAAGDEPEARRFPGATANQRLHEVQGAPGPGVDQLVQIGSPVCGAQIEAPRVDDPAQRCAERKRLDHHAPEVLGAPRIDLRAADLYDPVPRALESLRQGAGETRAIREQEPEARRRGGLRASLGLAPGHVKQAVGETVIALLGGAERLETEAARRDHGAPRVVEDGEV